MTPDEFDAELAHCKFIPKRVRDAVPDYQRFWAWEPGNMCCLHVVLDDANIDSDSVDFCLDQAERLDHPECLRMATVLDELTEEEIHLLDWVMTLWQEALRDAKDPRWTGKYFSPRPETQDGHDSSGDGKDDDGHPERP